MTNHSKSMLVMLVTQACCVTLGLHLHDSYLRASVDRGEASASANGLTADSVSAGEALGNVQPAFRLLTVGWILLMQAFVAFLTLSRIYRELTNETSAMRVMALTRERQVRTTRDALIFGLAALAESRDPETGRHLERISLYSSRLTNELFRRGLLPDTITREFLRTIGSSSTLHDIGKVSVRDEVLRKPGALTAEERLHIQTHTTVGGDCIRAVEAQTGDSHFLKMAREIALYHHERWDGTGYPHRVAGEQIPLAARIVAVADVYDALSVRRTYKPALPHEQCVEMIASAAGTQFDPTIVEAFLSIAEEFADIARYHSPGDSTTEDNHALPFDDHPASEDEQGAGGEFDADFSEEVIPLSLLLSSLPTHAIHLLNSERRPDDDAECATSAIAVASPGSPSR